MKRVFIVHGWEGYPEEGWFPWLKKELETRGFAVQVPELPDTAKPRIEKWLPVLTQAVGKVDADTYFVGHSMGCQTIVRLLENLPNDTQAGGAVFVGGWFKRLTGLEDDPDVQETDRHWLTTPVDLKKAKSHLKNSVAIFSDNDPWVPLDNQDDFRHKLGSEIIIEHNKLHFSGEQGIMELPSALEAMLKIANE